MSDDGRTFDTDAQEFDDIAPGVTQAPNYSVREGILSYTVGLVLAVGLTVASFLTVRTTLIWGPGIPIMLAVLAIAQMGVHLVFFLHITSDPDNTNNALALAFGVLIVFLVVVGSIWIMGHLDTRVMPAGEMMQHMMQIQR
jgi:cytochrome o ubiquinol oxidase operon protein cyoD